jgi:endonuclease YncB( thermonuclease family)
MRKLILVLTLLTPFSASSTEWTGTVIGISDGDTVKVLTTDKKQVKIRLVEIDAPEKKQAFGEQSKQSLSEICFKKPVIVDDKGNDKYKRTLGRLHCDGVDANAEQVRRGMAWAYTQYLTDQTIADLEQSAKNSRIGLWADDNPIPPWDFRHGGKEIKSSKTPSDETTSDNGFKCGDKTKCKEMDNCAEAKFYLNNCGLSRLDRDNDGIPCESICK